MFILNQQNRSQKLLDLISSARTDLESWHKINIKTMHSTKNNVDVAVEKLLGAYGDQEGAIFKVSDYKIIMLLRWGEIENHGLFKRDIERHVFSLGCRVSTRKITEEVLKSIAVEYILREGDIDKTLYEERKNRENCVMMIIDDDGFVSNAAKELLNGYGTTYVVEDELQVAGEYLKYNPDIVFLDIEMPNKNGLQVLDEIMTLDPNAYIIMLSGNSYKENVLTALSTGAIGFLTKPINENNMVSYLKQCTTILSN